MGMYDDVIINKENNLGLPVGNYQTKSLNLALDVYELLPDGKLVITKHFTGGRYWDSEEPKQYPAWCKGMNGMFTIYDNSTSYDVYIEDGIVIKTIKNGDECGGDIDFNDIEWVYEF